MIAPTLERAPRMLLVIGEDEQGLPDGDHHPRAQRVTAL